MCFFVDPFSRSVGEPCVLVGAVGVFVCVFVLQNPLPLTLLSALCDGSLVWGVWF